MVTLVGPSRIELAGSHGSQGKNVTSALSLAIPPSPYRHSNWELCTASFIFGLVTTCGCAASGLGLSTTLIAASIMQVSLLFGPFANSAGKQQ